MIAAFEGGDVGRALELHRSLLPVFDGLFRTQGVILAKAALHLQGLPGGPVRPPLCDATRERGRPGCGQTVAAAGLTLGDAAGQSPWSPTLDAAEESPSDRPHTELAAPPPLPRRRRCGSSRSAGSARSGAT